MNRIANFKVELSVALLTLLVMVTYPSVVLGRIVVPGEFLMTFGPIAIISFLIYIAALVAGSKFGISFKTRQFLSLVIGYSFLVYTLAVLFVSGVNIQ
jgi:hypothetical protein